MYRPLAAVTLFAALAASASAEVASCKTRLLQGLWVGHATDQADLYCLTEFGQDGVIVQSSCFNPKTLKPVGALSGGLTVSSECKVGGSFDLTIFKSGKVSPATFNGRLVREGQVMNGDFFIFGAPEDYRFYRQLD
jgi:hypothetical protein